MTGKRSFSSRTFSSQSLHVWGKNSFAATTSSSKSEHSIYGSGQGNASFSDNLFDRFQASQNITGLTRLNNGTRLQNLMKIQEQTLNHLLNLLLGNDARMNSLSRLDSSLSQPEGGQYISEFYHEENETTSFQTGGTVKTSDGREVNFNVELTMSRSFTQYASQPGSLTRWSLTWTYPLRTYRTRNSCLTSTRTDMRRRSQGLAPAAAF